jgi:hypothetical protein
LFDKILEENQCNFGNLKTLELFFVSSTDLHNPMPADNKQHFLSKTAIATTFWKVI